MEFEEEEYRTIEKILLGEGQFNKLQRQFIELFETKTIIAGPGAGKTTALVAKIALLLQRLNKVGSNDGICIITHTNVAVKEIKNTLGNIGISDISHPHFIGTIHEFFNRFCVNPYFKNELKHNSLFFDAEHLSDQEFFEKYLEINKKWMLEGVRKSIAKRINSSTLYFNKSSESLDLHNTSNWDVEKYQKYKTTMLSAKIKRKEQGFLQYDDTFVFSKLFLSNLKIKDILKKRFKYIFIDEFQDTNPVGEELLRELFNSENNIFQRVGDPYQTITYGQPMPEIIQEHTIFLNLTNRFGDQITQVLNDIMPSANIQSSIEKTSFKPIILLYDDEKDIYDKYKLIINEYEERNCEFRNSIKEDKALILAKKWTSILKPGSVYKDKKNNSLKSKNNLIKNLIIDYIVKNIVSDREEIPKIKNWVIHHSEIPKLHNVLLKMMKKSDINDHKEELKEIIENILLEKNIENIGIVDYLFSKIEDILNSASFVGTEETKKEVNDVFTIHSVKGETLRSVLLVDFNEKFLTKILLDRYGIYESQDYTYTHHNLLYVAMSRVTHLFVFAMHKNDWNEEIGSKLESKWIIREI